MINKCPVIISRSIGLNWKLWIAIGLSSISKGNHGCSIGKRWFSIENHRFSLFFEVLHQIWWRIWILYITLHLECIGIIKNGANRPVRVMVQSFIAAKTQSPLPPTQSLTIIQLRRPFYPPRTLRRGLEPGGNRQGHLELQIYQLSIQIGANQPFKVSI